MEVLDFVPPDRVDTVSTEDEELLRQLAERSGNDVRDKGFWQKLFSG